MKTNAALFIILTSFVGVWSRVPKWHRPFERRFNDLERKVLDESVEFRNELLTLLDKVDEITDDAYNASHTELRAADTSDVNDGTAICGENTDVIAEALTAGFGAEKEYVRRTLLKFKGIAEQSLGNLETRLRDQIEATERELDGDIASNAKLIHENEKFEADILERVDTVQKGLKKEISDLKNDIAELTSKAVSCDKEVQKMKANTEEMNSELSLKMEEILNDMKREFAQMKCGSWIYFMDSCYNFTSTEKVAWQDARDKCLEVGGYLAEVDTAEENDFLRTMAHERNIELWIGGSDLDKEGLWQWSYSKENVSSAFNGWGPGEPNGGIRENCIHMYSIKKYKWNDVSCSNKYAYLCEKRHRIP